VVRKLLIRRRFFLVFLNIYHTFGQDSAQYAKDFTKLIVVVERIIYLENNIFQVEILKEILIFQLDYIITDKAEF